MTLSIWAIPIECLPDSQTEPEPIPDSGASVRRAFVCILPSADCPLLCSLPGNLHADAFRLISQTYCQFTCLPEAPCSALWPALVCLFPTVCLLTSGSQSPDTRLTIGSLVSTARSFAEFRPAQCFRCLLYSHIPPALPSICPAVFKQQTMFPSEIETFQHLD